MYSETLTPCLHAKYSPSGQDPQGKKRASQPQGIPLWDLTYITYMVKVGAWKKQGHNHLCGPRLPKLNHSDQPLPPFAGGKGPPSATSQDAVSSERKDLQTCQDTRVSCEGSKRAGAPGGPHPLGMGPSSRMI